jgi:hypothetical protein
VFSLAATPATDYFGFSGRIGESTFAEGKAKEVHPMAAATAAPTIVHPSWQTHQWSEPDGRRVEIERGKPLIQHYCQKCGRTFVEDQTSKERYAVHVSAIFFKRLIDDVNERWLSAPCPGKRLETDVEDEKKWSGQNHNN